MSETAKVSQPTCYQILQLRQHGGSIDPFELRVAYRRALLLYHPDKSYRHSSNTSMSTTDDSNHAYSVDEITNAYKTLSKAVEKASYDKSLARDTRRLSTISKTERHVGVETYDLAELAYNEKMDTWSHKCRCGDQQAYMLVESDLEQEAEHGEIYVSCKGCSLSIRVLFDTAPLGSEVEDGC